MVGGFLKAIYPSWGGLGQPMRFVRDLIGRRLRFVFFSIDLVSYWTQSTHRLSFSSGSACHRQAHPEFQSRRADDSRVVVDVVM